MKHLGQIRVVYIVDNDASVRKSLLRLMRVHGFEAKCFSSPQQLLDEVTAAQDGCLLLDMAMSAAMGKALKAQLKERKIDMPIIATSVRDDTAVREDAHRIGAQFFLSKPVDNHALLDTIAWVAGPSKAADDVKGEANDRGS